jgi:segregation and condensation protein B
MTDADEQKHTGEIDAERIIEAILFASDSPLPAARIAQLVGAGDARAVRRHVDALNQRYDENGNAFRIEEIAGGYQFLTRPQYNTWLSRLRETRRDTKLSPAALETLAIVAYKQPIVKADIEAIRGVAVGEVVNRLREMNLVKIVGRAEELGRPMLYGTTKRFLEVFGLASLDDLPQIEALPAPK